MNKDKQPPVSSITDPAGKSIMASPKYFREHYGRLINETKFPFTIRDRQTFRDAVEGQRKLGSMFTKAFRHSTGKPYSKANLHAPWPAAPYYERLNTIFLYHPCFSRAFLRKIDQYFYLPVIRNWRLTQEISYFPKTSDYYARALPGTSNKARGNAVEQGNELLKELQSVEPARLKADLTSWAGRLFNNRWVKFGGSLFPLGYRRGDNHYGRLR